MQTCHVGESARHFIAVRCEKCQYLDKPLRLVRPSTRQYQRLATLWFLSQGIHMGKGTVRMSSQNSRRACYVTTLIDETNWWHNVMMAVFHATSSPLAYEKCRESLRTYSSWKEKLKIAHTHANISKEHVNTYARCTSSPHVSLAVSPPLIVLLRIASRCSRYLIKHYRSAYYGEYKAEFKRNSRLFVPHKSHNWLLLNSAALCLWASFLSRLVV